MSHGVLRQSIPAPRSEEERRRELQKIHDYQALVCTVREKRAAQDVSWEALEKTSELLTENPEYYTIWNYRRVILQSLFPDAINASDSSYEETQRLIQTDLQFLVPLLQKFPKCYWIWNHRLWLLQQATRLLPAKVAMGFWQMEFGLVGKMLNRDSRNFHGWGYRREVVAALEDLRANVLEVKPGSLEHTMTKEELDYTTKMVGANLSNFSAWHSRSRLILKLLNERSASDEERRKMFEDELKLIHRALIDLYDQSIWFYHHNLMCACDPSMASVSMVPNLSDEERLGYLEQEIEAIKELLDEADDCKWIYQALVTYSLLVLKIKGKKPDAETSGHISEWLSGLRRLDPLRKGRWDDLEKSLDSY